MSQSPTAFLRYHPQLRRALITALSRRHDWIPLAPSSFLMSYYAQSSQAGTFGSGVRLAVMLAPQCRDNFVIDADHDWRQAWGSCRSSAAVVPQGGREIGRSCGRSIGYELPDDPGLTPTQGRDLAVHCLQPEEKAMRRFSVLGNHLTKNSTPTPVTTPTRCSAPAV